MAAVSALPAVSAGDSCGGAGVSVLNFDELPRFRRWSIFLPRAVSSDVDGNSVYIKSRSCRNPAFFEQTHARLMMMLGSCDLRKAMNKDSVSEVAHREEALEVVLQAQLIALGFLYSRSFHQALKLGELCVELVDALANSHQGLLFWQILCRVNLGSAYAHFRRPAEGRAVIREGLELAEAGSGTHPNPCERVLVGACYAHLGRIEMEAGEVEEALRYTDLQIEVFERFIWELSDTREDKEVEAMVLASAYRMRGTCDGLKQRYDSALTFLARAQECIESHADVGADCRLILAQICEDIKSMKLLQR